MRVNVKYYLQACEESEYSEKRANLKIRSQRLHGCERHGLICHGSSVCALHAAVALYVFDVLRQNMTILRELLFKDISESVPWYSSCKTRV